jgi:alpha-glucosidase
MLLMTLRGTPFLYYGEEIGMTDVAIPPERVVDVHDRDGCRTPMQWDASPSAGFTTGEPWLPLAGDADRVNVAAQRDDPRSLLSLYRRLLATRRGSLALRLGAYRSLPSSRGVYSFERSADGERVYVALNFTSAERGVDLPPRELVLSTDDARASLARSGRVAIGPNEGLIARAA